MPGKDIANARAEFACENIRICDFLDIFPNDLLVGRNEPHTIVGGLDYYIMYSANWTDEHPDVLPDRMIESFETAISFLKNKIILLEKYKENEKAYANTQADQDVAARNYASKQNGSYTD